MYNTHWFLDGVLKFRKVMDHIPRTGETIRMNDGTRFVTVTEIVWCMDEKDTLGQRVNIRMETEVE